MQTTIQLLTGSKISTTDIGTLINVAYRQLLLAHDWSGRVGETVANTVAEYSTGTVTATNGSADLVGAGTTWTSGMVGRYIRINDEDVHYKITVFTSTTAMTIEAAWPFTTATAVAYAIFGLTYALGSDVDQPTPYVVEQNVLEERDLGWVSRQDPARRVTGSVATNYIPHGVDSSGNYLLEFWPRFSSATTVRIPYKKRADDLSGAGQPLIPSELIEARALQYCCEHLTAKFGDLHWIQMGQNWSKIFGELWETLVTQDYYKHGLPLSIPDTSQASFGHEFAVAHDV